MSGDQSDYCACRSREQSQGANIQNVHLKNHAEQMPQPETNPAGQQKQGQTPGVAADNQMKDCAEQSCQNKTECRRWAGQYGILRDDFDHCTECNMLLGFGHEKLA